MGNKIRTEADRKATPRPVAPKGVTFTTGRGQKRSLERGAHTRSKKNPGKRPHQADLFRPCSSNGAFRRRLFLSRRHAPHHRPSACR